MKCMVTGATGFIGMQLCAALKEKGHEIVALQRGACRLDTVDKSFVCQLNADTKNLPPMDGINIVFHLAAIVHEGASDEDYYSINRDGTMLLARQAAKSGVQHFIFLSSVKAMGISQEAKLRTELDILEAVNDPYGNSKRQAEIALESLAESTSMRITCIRSTLIYGAGVKANLRALVQAGVSGIPRPAKAGKRSMVALSDVVNALLLIAEPGGWDFRCFIVADNQSYDSQQILDTVTVALGRKVSSWFLPLVFFKVACFVKDFLEANSEARSYGKLFDNALFSSQALQQQTGWRPRATLESVMPEMLQGLSNYENKTDK